MQRERSLWGSNNVLKQDYGSGDTSLSLTGNH